jgi:dienelactone hydrolase
VTAPKMKVTHTFMAKDADPGVTLNNSSEVATVDPSSPKMVGKLVLPFGGLGTNNGITGPAGDFLVKRGFHVLGVAAFQTYDLATHDPDFYGDARRTVFEGKNYTHKNEFANLNFTPSDGVAMRVQKALQYLQKMAPAEDWGYFLNTDGSVRWSDVAFTGQSHGASNSPRFAKLVRAWRSVSFAGPRENECLSTNTPTCEGVVTATWLTDPSATPLDRFYGVTGTQDEQHPQHLFAYYKAQYPGEPVPFTVGPPYNNSHRIVIPGGPHAWFCDENAYKALCNYLFSVPVEDQ